MHFNLANYNVFFCLEHSNGRCPRDVFIRIPHYGIEHIQLCPFEGISDALQMPVALLRREQMLDLKQNMKLEEHVQHSSYRFSMREHVGDADYESWVSKWI